MSLSPELASYLQHPLVLIGFVLSLVFGVFYVLLKDTTLEGREARVQKLMNYTFFVGLLIVVLGFGVQFVSAVKTPEATPTQTEVNLIKSGRDTHIGDRFEGVSKAQAECMKGMDYVKEQ